MSKFETEELKDLKKVLMLKREDYKSLENLFFKLCLLLLPNAP